jgi:hypothetical protein
MSWEKDWAKYVRQQSAIFEAVGIKYPHRAVTEIVARAIMAKSDAPDEHMAPEESPWSK